MRKNVTQKSVAGIVAETFNKAGIKYAFGIPGGGMIPLIEELRLAGIRFILARHEAAAAFMADGYARIGRGPAVCMGIMGPEATNLVPGIANAFLDRSPILALTGQHPDSIYPIQPHQRIDLQALFRPITKLTTVLPPANASQVLVNALRVAQTPRQGPVHIQINHDVTQSPAGDDYYPRPTLLYTSNRGGEIEAARSLLQDSRFPVIVAGVGLEPEGPYQELRAFAEGLNAPVILTPKAKGALPASHPLYAGVIGLTSREAPFDLLLQSDLVITIGLDVVELVAPWTLQKPMLTIDQAPNIDPSLPASLEIQGYIGPTLQELAKAFYGNSQWEAQEISRVRPMLPDNKRGDLIPSQILRILQEVLPQDAIITCDVGSHKLHIGKYWPAETPNSFLISNGLSIMGYALPAAIGAKLAQPERTVVCLIGDGGFGMVMAELETARRVGLSLVVVVFVDHALSLIKLKQEATGYLPLGTTFGEMDYVSLARGCGAQGIAVDTAWDFAAAVAQGMENEGPFVIAARIDTREYTEF
ncbi:MAG: thiamine pyrophosphate-binding protein [Chloroflexi bacterium]|nr:thiamine pyrophosphate-binding protein [Chloroflexota bacterium]